MEVYSFLSRPRVSTMRVILITNKELEAVELFKTGAGKLLYCILQHIMQLKLSCLQDTLMNLVNIILRSVLAQQEFISILRHNTMFKDYYNSRTPKDKRAIDQKLI